MPPLFPDAALDASRAPQRALPLVLRAGALPAGLAGHLFILSPVGSVDSGGAPYPDGNDRPTVINGDGMVWRVDFTPTGAVANAEIVKPPDYHWDELTKNGTPLAFAGFFDMGMLRASLFLGTRNFANTAFVPLPPKPGEAGPTRMLCCYDAGPPVEIDPSSLATLGVVGESWDAEALAGLVAFPPILTTAHPMWDPRTGELFAVNYGRSGLSMLETVPLFEALAFLPEAAANVVGRVAAALGKVPVVHRAAQRLIGAASWVANAARGAKQPAAREDGILPETFFDLVHWTGSGDIVRVPVIDVATGAPAVVEQSMHQVAVTKRHVLLLDTNFKLRFDQFYSNPFPGVPELERLLRAALASQQGATSNLWVVRRDALRQAVAGTFRAVPAFKVPLLGAVHMLADYDDDDGIRVVLAHGTALDIAEWVRRDDLRLDGSTVREQMHGMVASEVDVSRLGQVVIDPVRRRVVESRILSDDRLWGIALYAGRGIPAWDMPPDRMRYVFWFASGLWQDNYTLFLRALYAEYPDRQIPLAEVDRLVARGGKPSTLVCVDLEAMAICDDYAFPEGVSLSSPQFIPDPARAGDRGGWLTAVVWDATTSWIWVFDAESLASGPIAQLEVPATLGFSLHTAWLPEVGPVPASAGVDWREALRRRIAGLSDKARARLAPLLRALDELDRGEGR